MEGCSIVIPVYNEQEKVRSTIEQLKDEAGKLGLDHEIIVINDGSTDDTAKAIRGSDVKLITHPQRSGYGKAIQSGILSSKHEHVVIIDADGTYPIESLGKLWKFAKDYDMVVGARKGKYYKGSIIKNPARQIYLWLIWYVTGKKVPDANSGFRIFKKSVILPFFSHLCLGYSFTTTLTLYLLSRGHFVKFVPIKYYKRSGRSKVRHIRDSLGTLQIIIQAIMLYNPIKAILPLFLLFFIFGSSSIFWYMFRDNNTAFFTAGIFSFGISALIFVAGLIADLLVNLKHLKE
ncbi:MAG: glycosyltransferase family 2 protein [Candidatus Omnitrophica bacterium]|nr:glycosyltransferase family 2 protein [Candidatus Omnitrophota bacterium]